MSSIKASLNVENSALVAITAPASWIGEVKRVTKETDIYVRMNLDCSGTSDCSTGIPFLDHMLDMKLVKPVDLFQKLLKTGSVQQRRLLGLDVGNKYVGLAVSDTENKIALPHSVLVRTKTNIDLMAKDFQTLVSRFSLMGFVVGYPFSLQGQASIEAIQVKLFIEDLKKTGKLDDMSYTYWDENFTSKCVEALLEPLDLHPVEYKTILDKFAAVGILQGYLDDMQRKLNSGNIHNDE